jgi:hypothetical protein
VTCQRRGIRRVERINDAATRAIVVSEEVFEQLAYIADAADVSLERVADYYVNKALDREMLA